MVTADITHYTDVATVTIQLSVAVKPWCRTYTILCQMYVSELITDNHVKMQKVFSAQVLIQNKYEKDVTQLLCQSGLNKFCVKNINSFLQTKFRSNFVKQH